jgi:hypothetical protein
MGLLPQVILGALLIVAFALSAHQRLAIASHTGPMPARQIAYLMRTHHQAAVNLKQATPSLQTVVDAAPPSMNLDDFVFLSCVAQKSVATFMMTITAGVGPDLAVIPRLMISTAEANAVVEELKRQSVVEPELGSLSQAPWAAGYGGNPAALVAPSPQVGFSDNVTLPASCLYAPGVPTIVTQVIP